MSEKKIEFIGWVFRRFFPEISCTMTEADSNSNDFDAKDIYF